MLEIVKWSGENTWGTNLCKISRKSYGFVLEQIEVFIRMTLRYCEAQGVNLACFCFFSRTKIYTAFFYEDAFITIQWHLFW